MRHAQRQVQKNRFAGCLGATALQVPDRMIYEIFGEVIVCARRRRDRSVVLDE